MMHSLRMSFLGLLIIGITTVSSFAQNQLDQYFPPNIPDEIKNDLTIIVNKLLETAKEAINNEDIKTAVNVLKGAIQLLPNDYRSYELLADIHSHYHNFNYFINTLEESTRHYADSDALFTKAIDSFLENNPSTDEKMILPHIADFKDDKKAAISFMFDDGELNVATHVIPIFKQYGYRMTIPVNPGVTPEKSNNPWRGSWEQWRKAKADGFEIANHGMNHRNLTVSVVTDDVLELEINKSYDMIKEKIGVAPTSFIFPFNLYDKKSTDYAKNRHPYLRQHELLFPLQPVFMPVYGGPFFSVQTANKVVDFAIKKKIWLGPICHGMKVEEIHKSFKPITQDFLVEHLEYIKKNEEVIWVDTIANVYAYLYTKAHARLIIEKQTENRVRVHVEYKEQPLNKNQHLTVVIPVSRKISSVSTLNPKTKKAQAILLREDEILVDVPLNAPIDVSWSFL